MSEEVIRELAESIETEIPDGEYCASAYYLEAAKKCLDDILKAGYVKAHPADAESGEIASLKDKIKGEE